MFWKPADPQSRPVAARWPMTTRLTLYYTLSVFVLLAAASTLLYWGLRSNLLAQDESFLAYKVQVLTVLLEHRPLERSAVDQEVLEEAEISSQSPAPFFLRVLEQTGRVVDETPGMAPTIPVSAFQAAQGSTSQGQRWDSGSATFLLVAVAV